MSGIFDVAHKKVTVFGLGLSGGGVGVAKWLLKKGAKVLITDKKTEKDLAPSIKELKKLKLPFELVLGRHREQDFVEADLIIKNPGIPNDSPYLQKAIKANVPVDTDLGIFVDNFPGKIIAVTGTKGKTTTTTLLYKIISNAKSNVILGGNLRKSPLDALENATASSLAVLELSSFQLEGLAQHKYSPQVAVWTNLYPDHLDRYKNIQAYAKAKENIFLYQRKEDYLITNADQKELVEKSNKAISQVRLFSTKKDLKEGVFIRKDQIIAKHNNHEEIIGSISNIKLTGEHNRANVLAAITAAMCLAINTKIIREIIETFEGVENRLEEVATKKGVNYVNDTASTIPASVIAALGAYQSSIILIAGGVSKNLPLDKLAQTILFKVKKVVLFNSEVGQQLKEIMEKKDFKKAQNIIVKPLANSMGQAVNDAAKLSEAGDTVLLSPGAASFDMFQNEFDRGEQFVAAVKKL